MNEERWIPVTEAAEILRMTPRQVNRYGNDNRLRTKRAGRRILYAFSDVTRLADELQVDIRPLAPQSPLARPVEEVRDYLQKLVEAQHELERLIRIPNPSGPSKEELRDLLREVLAEQEAERRREAEQREALRSQEQQHIPWFNILVIVLLVAILAAVVYSFAAR